MVSPGAPQSVTYDIQNSRSGFHISVFFNYLTAWIRENLPYVYIQNVSMLL